MQSVRFLNLTDQDVLCCSSSDTIALPPELSQLVILPPRCSYVLLNSSKEPGPDSVKTKPGSWKLKISLALGASWQAVKVPSDCQWRIYGTRPVGGLHQFTIFPKRNLASFLSEMPDATPLYSLLLPGTHDTMAFYGWIISQCQSIETPLNVQLHNGIRVLDIRLAVIEGGLIAYHGLYPQKTPFQTILSTVYAFLRSPASCRETIVMSVKQEDYSTTPQTLFSRLVREEFMNGLGGSLNMLFLENRVPKLGEVRGKVILLSRFGGNGAEWENGLEGLGIHPTTWPDSKKDGFTWQCKNVHVRTHDWYAIPSFLYIPEKVSLATEFLISPDDVRPTLSIVYTSASSFPWAAPKTIAQGFGWPKWGLGVEGVNSRVGRWILDALSSTSGDTVEATKQNLSLSEPRLRGWVLMDFYDRPEHALVELLVECNFRGRQPEEG
ncbi:PLC-like phosphodiesterase [Rhodocollybia butyracea]|uniref:PLC-like phosphodiesterase n=1 Tax=Rhodocollybia butyracea TaxID=206335 RepID=A0A9P5PTP9_9AGAR|nr:PLC-like phosphodiesterase [Rhodocollybia butyracea]